MARADAGSPTSKRVSNAVRVAILSPSVLLFISAVRLLIIANYDPTTASAIASSIGVVGTLLGTLIPIVPALLPFLALSLVILRKPLLLLFAAIGTALVSPAYATPREAWLATMDQFTSLAHALSSHNSGLERRTFALSWVHGRTSLIFGAIAVVVIAIDKREKLLRWYRYDDSHLNYDLPEKISKGGVTALAMLVCAAVLDISFGAIFFFTATIYHLPYSANGISVIVRQPWLPAEKVALKSGETVVGYTLNAGDIWYVFLQESNRTIKYFHEDEVVSRTLCQLPGDQRPNRPPLIKLINAPAPIVPRCP